MTKNVQIACKLPVPELEKRIDVDIRALVEYANNFHELSDGYTLYFPAEELVMTQIYRFIVTERSCCSFLEFRLVVPPDFQDVSLTITGPSGVKAFIQQLMPENFMQLDVNGEGGTIG